MNINYQTLIQKNEILEELNNGKYIDLQYSVYRKQLTYDEIIDILDLKNTPTKRTEFFLLNPGFYEVSDLNNSLHYILPDKLKASVTIDDVRLKSRIKINQTSIFTEKSIFMLYWGLLDHIGIF